MQMPDVKIHNRPSGGEVMGLDRGAWTRTSFFSNLVGGQAVFFIRRPEILPKLENHGRTTYYRLSAFIPENLFHFHHESYH